MKLQILQENLDKAVEIASRFASTRAQLPILGNILITCQKTKIFVSSTNLEISVSVSVGAKVDEEGDLSVPARVISELVGNLPKENISLESEKEQLKISSPGFSSTILGMSSSDFPKIPNSIDVKKSIVLPKNEFVEALSQTLFATSTDETRPVLTGVLFLFDTNLLTLVSTDGFRLSQKKIKVPGAPDKLKLVVPRSVLLELSRNLGEGEEILFNYNEKEKQVVFGVGDIVLTSRLLEGEYPDFEKIIPKKSLCSISLDKNELLRAVKLTSIFARDSANIVKFKIGKDSVKIFAESSQSGSQNSTVDAKIETSSDFDPSRDIAFNFHFLEDFLHSLKGENVEIKVSTSTAAGVFGEPTEPDYLHLIMPVRVQD